MFSTRNSPFSPTVTSTLLLFSTTVFLSCLNSIVIGSSIVSYPSGACSSVILYLPYGTSVTASPFSFVTNSTVGYNSELFNVTFILFTVNLSSPSSVDAFL